MSTQVSVIINSIQRLTRSGIEYKVAQDSVFRNFGISEATMVEVAPGNFRKLTNVMPSLMGVHIPN